MQAGSKPIRLFPYFLAQHESNTTVTPNKLLQLLTSCLLALALIFSTGAYAAEGIEIKDARIELADDGYRLASVFDLDLNHGLEDALSRGVPLYFTIEVELTRPRWYWFDEKTLRSTQTLRLSYNVLTRKYLIAIPGGVQQSFNSMDEALLLVRRPSRWLIAGKGALKNGEVYNVMMRMSLNLEFMSKPFQVNALNNSDWRLSSERKNFSFKVEEK